MNLKMKKVIAREGLAIIVFVSLGILAIFLPADGTHNFLASKVLSVAILGYPVYLTIRFIIWAIKTLRKK